MSSIPKILVTHPWMGHGGSEATAMWTLNTLQTLGEVSFTTASAVDWDELNATYGTAVSPSNIKLIRAPRIPGIRSGTQLVDLQNSLFIRHCRRLAPDFDILVSAYNVLDFGQPSIQLIGDFSWAEELRQVLYPNANDRFQHRQSPLRSMYLKVGELVRGPDLPIADRGDLFLANSRWTQQILKNHYTLESEILYPPVLMPDEDRNGESIHREPTSFISVGRISPEKELKQTISILDRLRELDHDVTLHVAGASGGDSQYVAEIEALISERDWITAHGFLKADELEALLHRCSFGIHGCSIEAFGIAIAEMAAHGCLPVVPDSGGGIEVVSDPQLHFSNVDDAVARIEVLLRNPEKAERLRSKVVEAVRQFAPEHFANRLRAFVFGHENRSTESAAMPSPSSYGSHHKIAATTL